MDALWVAFAGMIVYLDTSALAQFMICQPIIACPLWGVLVGRPEIGLFFGTTFQWLGLGSLPIGAAKFPEGNMGALVATAVASQVPASAHGEPAWTVLTIATLMGILSAHVGQEVTPLVRKVMNAYAPPMVAAAQAGLSGRFRWLFAGAVTIHALAGFLLTIVAFLFGKRIVSLPLGDLASEMDAFLQGIWPGLLGTGGGLMVARFVQKKNRVPFAVALVAALALVGAVGAGIVLRG